MADINTIQELILLCRKANITPFIWGSAGIGKSSLVRQLCQKEQIGFVDFRMSQIEAVDLRGFPDVYDGTTVYRPPSELPQRGEGIIFLDELNRAQDDVIQASFQFILDRQIGSYKLPKGWSIVAAGNFTEGYLVNNFDDPAFISRFCHVVLDTTETSMKNWINWMVQTHGDTAQNIIEFVTSDNKYLYGNREESLGFPILPTPRGWDMVARALQYNPPKHVLEELIAGLVGREAAIAYAKYDCPVKPTQVLENGVEPYADIISTLDRNQLLGLSWGIIGWATDRINEDNVAQTCLDYAELLLDVHDDKDIALAFIRNLTDVTDKHNLRSAALSNPQVAEIIASIVGEKSFISKISKREKLQQLLSETSLVT